MTPTEGKMSLSFLALNTTKRQELNSYNDDTVLIRETSP